jgi:hypothetical protein
VNIRKIWDQVKQTHWKEALEDLEFGEDPQVVCDRLVAEVLNQAPTVVRLIAEAIAPAAFEVGTRIDDALHWNNIKNDRLKEWLEAHDNPGRLLAAITRFVSRDLQAHLAATEATPGEMIVHRLREAGWSAGPFARRGK